MKKEKEKVATKGNDQTKINNKSITKNNNNVKLEREKEMKKEKPKSMLDIIHENHIIAYESYVEERKRMMKKTNRLIILGLITFIVLLISLIVITEISFNNNLEKCIKAGYDKNHCVERLG